MKIVNISLNVWGGQGVGKTTILNRIEEHFEEALTYLPAGTALNITVSERDFEDSPEGNSRFYSLRKIAKIERIEEHVEEPAQ